MGGHGWINTGGIRGEAAVKVIAEAVAEAVVAVVVAAVWFIGCGKSTKGCHQDCLFLFSYI